MEGMRQYPTPEPDVGGYARFRALGSADVPPRRLRPQTRAAGLFCVESVCCVEPSCPEGATCAKTDGGHSGLCTGSSDTACASCGGGECFFQQQDPTCVEAGCVGGFCAYRPINDGGACTHA